MRASIISLGGCLLHCVVGVLEQHCNYVAVCGTPSFWQLRACPVVKHRSDVCCLCFSTALLARLAVLLVVEAASGQLSKPAPGLAQALCWYGLSS